MGFEQFECFSATAIQIQMEKSGNTLQRGKQDCNQTKSGGGNQKQTLGYYMCIMDQSNQ